MISVVAKPLGTPGRVRRSRTQPRLSVTAKLLSQPNVLDALRTQALGQRLPSEMGEALGTRESPHIGHDLDPIDLEDLEELSQRARGMSHGKKLHSKVYVKSKTGAWLAPQSLWLQVSLPVVTSTATGATRTLGKNAVRYVEHLGYPNQFFHIIPVNAMNMIGVILGQEFIRRYLEFSESMRPVDLDLSGLSFRLVL